MAWIYAVDIDPAEWPGRWPHIRLDQLDYPERMRVSTLDLFNTMCAAASERNQWTHRINSSFRVGDPRYHGKGMALDVVFYSRRPGDVPLDEQYALAKQFPWGGIGLYPRWKAPGLHLDDRDHTNHVAFWWRESDGSDHGVAEYESTFGTKLT